MRLFIWNRLSFVTDRYHSEAGVVVVASSLEEAVGMVAERSREVRANGYFAPNEVLTEVDIPEPDAQYTLSCAQAKRLFVFPDAGCCS